MTTALIYSGLPASGKSTHARELDALRFNLDDARAMLGITPDNWTREKEEVALQMILAGAKAAVQVGFDVAIDNTHIVPRIPARFRKELGPLGVDWVVHDFTDVSVDECIKRDAERDNPVGEAVIRKMAKRMGTWRLTEEWLREGSFDAPDPYVPDGSLPGVFIADLDGTLALHTEAERGHFEYHKVGNDRPNHAVIDLVKALVLDGNRYDVVFMSGREDRCRHETEQWLKVNVGISSPLFMRATGDHRPDSVVKLELFNKFVRDNYHVRFVLDDRNSVIGMWRSLGLDAFQVNEGNF